MGVSILSDFLDHGVSNTFSPIRGAPGTALPLGTVAIDMPVHSAVMDRSRQPRGVATAETVYFVRQHVRGDRTSLDRT